MTTFVDQIRELGVKQAVIVKTDEVVERITAGMNVGDIRAALKGDEPRRPNPRLRPHADAFWLHIRPSFYHTEVTNIYPTFRMGWLSSFMFVWETITGIILMVFYTPSPLIAYSNMWNIISNVPMGQLFRNMHRLGAEVMVLVVALHMLRTFITGSYKKPRQFTWATGMLLLVLTLLLSFSGYLLPWDQLAYWALTVFLSGAEAAPAPPVINQNILLILQGGPALGASGLLRWYLFHVLLLPLLLGIFFFVHYYKVVLHGLSLPPGREEIGDDTAKRVPRNERTYFIPDILTSELMWTALLTLFLVAGSLWLWDAPLETHADPVITPLHVVAPWYLSWSQGWLKLADKTLVVGFIPLLMVAFIVMPYFEVGKSRRYADRRIGLSVSMLFIAFMLVSNWMGTPEFRVESSPDREVSIEVLPEEGASLMLAVPFDEMKPGAYLPGQDVSGSPFLTEALQAYEEALAAHSCTLTGNPDLRPCRIETLESGELRYSVGINNQEAMPDPYSELRVTDAQKNLLELVLYYEVVDPENPDEFLFLSDDWVKYKHRDSNYAEECGFVNKC
ncbi:MAG: cytochrome b N-terminal domain-containing protein [Candidatus Promineifilaceae bacterium]|nr:cytochrome b N-terminal domain-containing protein [Candidatus Promineifilaceae bacterium]